MVVSSFFSFLASSLLTTLRSGCYTCYVFCVRSLIFLSSNKVIIIICSNKKSLKRNIKLEKLLFIEVRLIKKCRVIKVLVIVLAQLTLIVFFIIFLLEISGRTENER